MRCEMSLWRQLGNELHTNKIVYLCKALVYGEKLIASWSCGSVSPVVWLYGILESMADWDSEKTTNWLLSHTDNPYIPFTNHGAKSLDEYKQIISYLSKRKKARQLSEELRAAAGKQKQSERATMNLVKAIRRGDEAAVKALLVSGANPDYKENNQQTARELALELNRLDWLH